MCKSSLGRAVVSLAVVAAALMSAVPAGAAVEDSCARGKFCLFSGQGLTGSVVARGAYDNDLRDTAVGYFARSWRNRSGHTWYVFAEPHCSGYSTPLGAGDAGDVNNDWFGNIRSIARDDQLVACRK
ncbi:peptidase inhibitor family I36 protein [Kitasatospora sp. LaBMicrA B282]|uniref:peptidase inhibitor family I36 protein n=1 Tax=Kitasatospora sp. LaBMicrA B282 TaxID=3420949 RepID=UPI003D0D200D